MKTKDMEPQIKQLGLKMLEEKLEHNEVHYFICSRNTCENGDFTQGELVVFDKDGKAYVSGSAEWETDGSFTVDWRAFPPTDVSALMINGYPLVRYEDYDLKQK